MDKRFLAIIGVIIVLFVGFLVLRDSDEAAAPTAEAKPSSHVKGAENASVTLVEYGDFQCPACLQYYPVFEELSEKYKDQVTFQFRHFPLVSIHRNAFAASRAAEAAGLQGKFWEMYDRLYMNQSAWSNSNNVTPVFEGYARQIGLDVARYKTDFAGSTVNDTINADMREGNKLEISSTPTFVLNGEKLQGMQPSVEAFSAVIDAALAEQTEQE